MKTVKGFSKIVAMVGAVALGLTLSACGNTIRGLGRDTANAVDATKDAGHRIARAAN